MRDTWLVLDPVRGRDEMNSGPWMARNDEEFERRIVQEHASAHDLCVALRWHRASIAETLPVVDGDAERMAEVRGVLATLGRAREALAAYYRLPPVAATEDDPYAQGDPPRLHARAAAPLRAAAVEPRGVTPERQRWALQQIMALLDRDERTQPVRQPRAGLVARLFGRHSRCS